MADDDRLRTRVEGAEIDPASKHQAVAVEDLADGALTTGLREAVARGVATRVKLAELCPASDGQASTGEPSRTESAGQSWYTAPPHTGTLLRSSGTGARRVPTKPLIAMADLAVC